MKRILLSFALLSLVFSSRCLAQSRRDGTPNPPGTVISASPNWEKTYLGSPSMEILEDGTYLMSHDWFGDARQHTTVYESKDRGAHWNEISSFDKQNSSTMFRVGNALYLIGFCKPDVAGIGSDCIGIRKSTDNGKTWSTPTDEKTGLILFDSGSKYYADPVPVLFHNGRIFWQCDKISDDGAWGERFSTLVISAPVSADLLDGAQWTASNPVRWAKRPDYKGWLEGNVLADPDGKLVVYMRVEAPGGKVIARLNLSDDGKRLSFDPETGFLPFPGGASKFAIRYDQTSKKYWSLANYVQPGQAGPRNTLALVCSSDLKNWDVRSIVFQHKNGLQGFQYIDWRIQGCDIVFVCRLGWYGKNFHDSNYMIFDTVKDFRVRSRTQDAPLWQDHVSFENDSMKIDGAGFTVETLNNDAIAYSNRGYVYKNVPQELCGAKFTRVPGGAQGLTEIQVSAKRDTEFFAAVFNQQQDGFPKSFDLINDNAFYYTDGGKSQMQLFRVALKAGEAVKIPQVCWSGTQIIFGAKGPLTYNPPKPVKKLVRMQYNNPGLLDDLAVGLWSWPIPVDYNNDGALDLIVNCEDTPYNGVYRFQAISNKNEGERGFSTALFSSQPVKNAATPIFSAGERVSGGQINVQASFVDGQTRVLRPAQEFPEFAQSGLTNPVPLPLKANVHKNNVRGNFWKYVDFNGDGKLDLAIGTDDWTPYGWANAYDEKGVWKNDQSHGNVYIAINNGTNDKPEYGQPELLILSNGQALLTYGWPSPSFADFDNDGDLDLLCGEFRDSLLYFANIGTAQKPVYAPGVWVRLTNGQKANQAECMITPVVVDWNRDGRPDVVCGNEDGRVCLYENAGTFRSETIETAIGNATIGNATTGNATIGNATIDGAKNDGAKCAQSPKTISVQAPVFKPAMYFQQKANELKAGSLATPCCCDLNGDGATDIVAGTSAGNILFFENLGKPGDEFPRWARPVYLKAKKAADARKVDFQTTVDDPDDPKNEFGVISIIAGPNGSIQGPIEEKYGYTTLTVADWDGNGTLDLIVNSVLGKVGWFRNSGTKTAPQFDAFDPIEVEWNGPQPELAWGWMKPLGKQLLTQWRTTPVAYDWNGDGLVDLCMLDTEGYFAFFERFRDEQGVLKLKAPERIFCQKDGSPLHLNASTAGGSGRRKICIVDWDQDGRPDLLVNSVNANFFKNVKTENGKTFFEDCGKVDDRRLAGHTTSPTTADFNADGCPDLVIGAEDGRFYYLRNPIDSGRVDER